MSTFSKKLRAYTAEQIGRRSPRGNRRRWAAGRPSPQVWSRRPSIALSTNDNPELAGEHMRELASKQVAELIKELCEEPEARERLDAYGQSMNAFVSLRAFEAETVGECSARLRQRVTR